MPTTTEARTEVGKLFVCLSVWLDYDEFYVF